MSTTPVEARLTGDAPPFSVRVLTILWPAFLLAGVQEALVFVVVDPHTLHWFGAQPVDWPVQAIYSVTFLIFWFTTSLASALTSLLHSEADRPGH
jgi:hypothetical protein